MTAPDLASRRAGEPGSEFRWQYDDAIDYGQWTDWHVVADRCPTCCCGGGPVVGEHQSPAEYYEDDVLTMGHTRYDPLDPDWPRAVEWRAG